ncbi:MULTISPECIES: amidase [unclassified Ruegeria]|uniref:amidase n=1 Tax=unclassified Ruegeria TaxID=2625375 RepID=UPI001492927B|nr:MULTISPECIES: amidase family protein [unclassified Ruegeria]NOD47600.1 amidase [Ruegeria sp. HKCCD5849]NOD52737.1 amidase [Ruegeria sp. HKCCD5851]NOD66156.1 amidase [Ruegeria sp. HKCCD7303]
MPQQNNIIQKTATELAIDLRARTLSSAEVLGAHRARIEDDKVGVNAFVTLDWDAATARAEELDKMAACGQIAGPLHGLPIAIKDCFDTAGLRTTHGSKSFSDHVPSSDALHVARLRAAGAIIIGKTNTPEFTFSGQTTNFVSGTTRNPLNPEKTVAGSSGGAAAALVTNMVALADGSDLGGSARTPAAWCGVVGMRPTSGLVPMDPNPAPFDGLSVPCPMARTVSDLALMLSVMQGPTPNQPLAFTGAYPDPVELDAPLTAGRVALSLSPFGASVDPSVQAALAPIADLCRDLGWHVDEDTAPDLVPLLAYGDIIRGQCALQIRAALNPDMTQATESYRTACAQGEEQSLADLIAYQTIRRHVWDSVATFFNHYDFALWPTATGLPFSADLRDGEITEDWRTVTLTPTMELPSISIPLGRSSDGMPVGLHITGPKGSDARLLRFARQIERQISGD